MGCLIAFRCPPDSRTGDISVPHIDVETHAAHERERTNPDACISSPKTPFDLDATVPPAIPQGNCEHIRNNDVEAISREQVAWPSGQRSSCSRNWNQNSRAPETAYDVGRTIAIAAAPLVVSPL